MKLIQNIRAASLLLFTMKIFDPQEEFEGKRIAVVGAADSVFEEQRGEFIDGHDIVIRLNRAPYSWSPEKAIFLGSKFSLLYHSFYENNYSGGGPIDWEYYDSLGIKKVINPINSRRGLITQFNYYKRHNFRRTTFILSRSNYKELRKDMRAYVPTVGFSALMSVLQSDFKELYITGFTFFKTSYADDYRDHFQKKEDNQRHIEEQGLHSPDLEFAIFKKKVDQLSKRRRIRYDRRLSEIIAAG